MLLNMSATDLELLQQFTCDHSQDAFTTLVNRHLNLVYSAALRQVYSPALAEEVAQSVFADLARAANQLEPATVLTAWLYTITRRTAVDVIRKESRRQQREQIALEMNAINANDDDWTHIEPLLDEAMQDLDETDRAAVLLRYFENKSLREVGLALGLSDDAAQKRVSRAVEQLRESFSRRNVTIGASGLVVLISANTVQAAPAGLALTISAATLAGTAISTSTLITTTQTIAMTALQKTIITAALAVVAGAGIYEARQAANLRGQVRTLQQQQGPLAEQIRLLQSERNQATNQLAATTEELARARKNPTEVLKLRGEVGRLRQENALVTEKSALNKITANPETRKMLRDQQKLGMTAIYAGLVKQLNLSTNQAGQFNDLLADDVMDNVDLITQVLHDGKSREQINEAFTAADTTLAEKIETLVGADGLAAYRDYSQNLLSSLTSQQFSGQLTGDSATKGEKQKQFAQVLQEEAQAALASAGLPADFQTVPILNFRNIASEEEAEQNLKLIDSIYERAAARASTFLSADELEKFKEFRATAISNSRLMLTMNRKLMAPLAN